MKLTSVQFFAVLFLLTVSYKTLGNDKFTITWAVNDAPPFHIIGGELQNGGICDVLIDAFSELMPDTHFDTVIMPQSRINMLTKQKQNMCFPCLIKRTDNDVWVYSDVTVYHAPLGIIGKPSVLGAFVDDNGRISLEALTTSKKLRLGKPRARRYPEVLQIHIDIAQKARTFAEINGEKATSRVLSQIEVGRIDYTLEYPSILKYYNLTNAPEAVEHEPLRYYQTTELAGQRVAGAVGCTSNAWGKEAVTKLNQALPHIMASSIYQQQQAFWYGSPTPAL
ncbi:hypothetical protein [Alteromonas sp. S005]|uniref:hypothetical protein n=1 Tax=Alteromonas sp. S005 TaxID=3117400 RepID=UPI002FE0320A